MRHHLWRRCAGFVAVALAVQWLAVWTVAQADPERQREQTERVADVLTALAVRPGAQMADVGAGDGFYTVRIARAVAPSGRVAGVDVSERALSGMRTRVAREGLTNVDVVLGAADDPHLAPGTLDAILVHNAYHEMVAHEAMLKRLYDALRPGGRLVMAETIRESLRALGRDKQVAKHEIAPELAQQELQAAGFEIVERHDDFTRFADDKDPGGYWLIVARRPARPDGFEVHWTWY